MTVRARVSPSLIVVAGGAKSFGALVRFQLDNPTVTIAAGQRRTLATLRIPAPNVAANGTGASEVGADEGWMEPVGAPGDCRAPPGLATVFAVSTLTPGSYRIGGTIDWFSFERAP
eukprot:SAG22_NODE_8511_length_650_cov_0.691470_1_plen_116_part_00